MSDVYHDENGIEVESPKPSPIQIAEELVDEIRGCDYMDGDWDILKNDAIKLIESFAAAQRQAGREEMRSELVEGYAANILELEKRYAALEEAARDRIAKSCITCEWKDNCHGCAYAKIRKALADLEAIKNISRTYKEHIKNISRTYKEAHNDR